MKKNKLFIITFMILTLLFGFFEPVISTSESISNKVLRLHILANSDSTQDQNLKLMVKNYVLENASHLFCGDSLQDNIKIAKDNKYLIEALANECIKSNGYDYKAKVSVVREYFDTRVYDDFTLPAGEYNSIKIEIGQATGHNWWCIIFPSVCLSACTESMSDYLTEEEMKLVENKYTPKFKVVEIYEKIKHRISQTS